MESQALGFTGPTSTVATSCEVNIMWKKALCQINKMNFKISRELTETCDKSQIPWPHCTWHVSKSQHSGLMDSSGGLEDCCFYALLSHYTVELSNFHHFC